MSKYRSALIDPYKIPEDKLPIIVLADDRRGLLGFLIKNHSGGNYNHIQELHRPGYFASQDPVGYHEVPISKYKKPYMLLKFWSYKPLNDLLRVTWKDAIYDDLKNDSKGYDWLGILGHMLNIPWLNNPHLRYCSERVAYHLKTVAPEIFIPRHPTPSEINEIFNATPSMECLGYWIPD